MLSPELDPICKDIVDFLAHELNLAYTKENIVRSVRHYDAYNVPFQSYPLLKVYRLSDTFSIDNSIRESQMGLSYCLLNAELDRLPGITNWVAETITYLLRKYSLHKQGCLEITGGIRASYKTLLQLGQIIYQIDFTFGLRE